MKVTYGDRVRAQVNLMGLPRGRFSVDIEARLKNGDTMKGARRYFTCTVEAAAEQPPRLRGRAVDARDDRGRHAARGRRA